MNRAYTVCKRGHFGGNRSEKGHEIGVGARLYTRSGFLAFSCGKLTILLPHGCEVGYSDVVAEGFEVEFASLGGSLVAG